MKNEPTKLPMRKLIDYLENGKSVSTAEEFKEFLHYSIKIAKEFEIEELALIGDAHCDGMYKMREILEEQDLVNNNNEYIKEKFDKELPDVDNPADNIIEFQNGSKMMISGSLPTPQFIKNALKELKAFEKSQKNNQ